MLNHRAEIKAYLQKEILLLDGFKPAELDTADPAGLHLLSSHFPGSAFPVGAVHEFICTDLESKTASSGFIAAMVSMLQRKGGAVVWISLRRTLFPPSLSFFGLVPDSIIFIELKTQKNCLWALEESLKCEGLCCVVAEVDELSFVESRKFQLSVKQSRVTALLIRQNPRNLTTASVSRWKIQSLPSENPLGLPGVGYPFWKVELLRIRNGKPGSWQLGWKDGSFRMLQTPAFILKEEKRKAG